MSTYGWEEVERLFAEAIELAPDERRLLLDTRCAGRPRLRTELESLLASHDHSPGFLEVDTARPHGIGQVLLERHGANAGDGARASAAVNRVVGQYRLVEWIGAGGMGDVFRAEHLALGRPAAVKLLRRDFSADLRSTLIAEAEACAKLQHPAIATFYEAGEADGETFLAMEYVEGVTLRQQLTHGALAVEDAMAIVRCVLEALAHAHAASLLHRDIKPDNIIIVERRFAKLLDFGIAVPLHIRSKEPEASADAVTSGLDARPLVGTVGYLAPEQVAGGPLDVRTDLFQVGIVLFEMLTGRRAFRADSPLGTLTAAMTGTPDFALLDEIDMPAAVAAIIRRALAREARHRYESAAAFLRDLRAVDEGRPLPARQLVAIADFDNRSGDERLDWLGGALAEGINEDLAALEDPNGSPRAKLTRVLPRDPSDRDPVGASLGLGCSWLVRGETQSAVDGSIRVVVQLMEVTTGCVLASHDVHGPLNRVFSLQRRLSAALAADLRMALPADGAPGRDTTIEAHELFTRARLLIEGFGKGSLEDARDMLERALAFDAHHVGALAALATTFGLRAIASPNAADYERAVSYADRALASDPRHVSSLVWKCYALAGLGRHEESAQVVEKALTLDPHDTEALYFAAGVKLLWTTPPAAAEALEYLQRAVTADDSRGMWWLALGTAHRCLHRTREALYCFARAEGLEGTRSRFSTAGAAAYVGETLRRERRLAEARVSAFAGLEAAERSDHAYRDTFRAHALSVIGRIALDGGDTRAAAAAFGQLLAQARGRPQPRACGHFVVQALCGLARSTHEADPYDEAVGLMRRRETYNFSRFFGALESDTCLEVALAAAALGRDDEARAWSARVHEVS